MSNDKNCIDVKFRVFEKSRINSTDKKTVKEENDTRAKRSLKEEDTGKQRIAPKTRLHHILSLKLILRKKQ